MDPAGKKWDHVAKLQAFSSLTTQLEYPEEDHRICPAL